MAHDWARKLGEERAKRRAEETERQQSNQAILDRHHKIFEVQHLNLLTRLQQDIQSILNEYRDGDPSAAIKMQLSQAGLRVDVSAGYLIIAPSPQNLTFTVTRSYRRQDGVMVGPSISGSLVTTPADNDDLAFERPTDVIARELIQPLLESVE